MTANAGISATPEVLGAAISVATIADLAAYDVSGLTLGTRIYVIETRGSYRLSLSTTPSDSHDVVAVLGVGGVRWIRDRVFDVLDFGAVISSTVGSAAAVQSAYLAAKDAGGGIVRLPAGGTLLLEYPVFSFDHTDTDGRGCTVIFRDPSLSIGRGGFCLGSSVEANRDTALANYASGSYATGASTNNTDFVNLALNVYLRDHLASAQITGATIHDLNLVAQWTAAVAAPDRWGGYGVQFLNALDCRAWNISGTGFTQLIGMGSDTAPETPSNFRCTASGLHVISPDLLHTYYTVGLIANSSNCQITNARQYAPVTDASADGSGVGANVVQDCSIREIYIDNLGRSATSQGVLLNNSLRSSVRNVFVRNAITAVADFGTTDFWDTNSPNEFDAIVGYGCDQVISAGNKFTKWGSFLGINCTNDFAFLNLNITANDVYTRVPYTRIVFPGDQTAAAYLAANTIDVFPHGLQVLRGSGAPSITAPKGSLYIRTDGGAGTTLYVNESGTDVWVGK